METTLFSYYRGTVSIGESTFQAIQQEHSKIDKAERESLIDKRKSSMRSESDKGS
jgi:hypothetical protein